MNFTLTSITTKKLVKAQIIQICKLKNSHWKYGLISNITWFKKNIKENDIHNCVYYNSKLIGYTLLRNRTYYYERKYRYLYFDTLIINKNFRDKKISYFLMNLNNYVITKNKKMSFLICKDEMIEFYQKFNWQILKRKTFSIADHSFNTNGMCFNKPHIQKKLMKNKKTITFYLKK